MAVLVFGLGVVGLTILLWPITAIVRKHYGKPLTFAASEKKMRLLVRIVCILLLIFYIGWFTVVSLLDSPESFNSLPPWVIVFGILGAICTIGTILVWLNAVRSLQNPTRWIWAKLHDLVLALACLALIWFAFTWNLMNFNVHY
jgi:fluoride ion exporter CrcB/FEX